MADCCPCDWCQESIDLTRQIYYRNYDIKNYKSLTVCNSCCDTVDQLLQLSNCLPYPVIVEIDNIEINVEIDYVEFNNVVVSNSDKKLIFENIEELKEFLVNHILLHRFKLRYGYYSSCNWNKKLRKSFLGLDSCGGFILDEEIRLQDVLETNSKLNAETTKTINKIHDKIISAFRNPTLKSSDKIKIGFRGFYNNNKGKEYSKYIKESDEYCILHISFVSVDYFWKQFFAYLEKNTYLKGIPFYLLLPNTNYPKNFMANWCFPMNDVNLITGIPSIEELEKKLKITASINHDDHDEIEYEMTSEFMKKYKEKLENKLSQIQQSITDLNEL